MARVTVIGSGFSGLAAACFAAKSGHQVDVLEQHTQAGGRARSFSEQGFLFDMGPSWYWMPDVFDDFFACFGKRTSDYYTLKKLDPGFQIIFGRDDVLAVPADRTALDELFERVEPGSSRQLKTFLEEAAFKYRTGMQQLVYKPAFSWLEYASLDVLKGIAGSHMFTDVHSYVSRYFRDDRLVDLMEFPVLFLGAMPHKIPALYTLMNYAALVQGTYYPMGGMGRIVEGMKSLAGELGVSIHTGVRVDKIDVASKKVSGVQTSAGFRSSDLVIASADYHHVEQHLLDKEYRNYKEDYWSGKTFAPSCLIFYVGVKKKINNLLHHNLYFDTDFDRHAREIYTNPKWPSDPLFYVCCPSKTDDSVAPEGMENLFLLVPIATGLEDTDDQRELYFDKLIGRIEAHTGECFKDDIIYKRSYCINDFTRDYHAYRGNAYGLANTLRQTAVLKPKLKNRKVANLFYAGQLTVPGPGVPPALISGRLAAEQAHQYLKNKR
ncbi:MAG TPA: phytoene desaturase family protein [Chitinophagaceae bacterium]|nr:phytoene desaturase family protein [Chitinophagaceae bacterium]